MLQSLPQVSPDPLTIAPRANRQSDSVTAPAPAATSKPAPLKSFDKNLPSSLTPISAGEAELYVWDLARNEFKQPAELGQDPSATFTAQILKRPGSGYEYWLMVSSSEGPLIAHQVKSAMNQRWSRGLTSFTWNFLSDDGRQSSWCLRFLQEDSYAIFLAAFTQALWEALHQVSWGVMKVNLSPSSIRLLPRLSMQAILERRTKIRFECK